MVRVMTVVKTLGLALVEAGATVTAGVTLLDVAEVVVLEDWA